MSRRATVRRTLCGPGLLALALAGCTPNVAPEAPTPPPPASAAPAPTNNALEVNRPLRDGMTIAGIKHLCDANLERADTRVQQLRALDGANAALTFENTLGELDTIKLAIFNASEFPYLLGHTHPDPQMRRAARLCEAKTDAFLTGLYLDKRLASLFKRYAATAPQLSPERKRFMEETLRDFRRNGLGLDNSSQQRLREINKLLTELGQQYLAEISGSKNHVDLEPKQLAGLPPSYIKKHPPRQDGLVRITTNYTDYFPFVTFASDRAAAKKLYVQFVNRGGNKNVRRLSRILKLRQDKATLLGYTTWADYAIEPRMAKTASVAKAYLARVHTAIKPGIKRELAQFKKEFVGATGMDAAAMSPADRYFLTQRLKARLYKLDSAALAEHFDVAHVTQGLIKLSSEMYGLSFKPSQMSVWHPDVQAYVVSRQGREIATIFLDLYPRPAKYKHAAMFSIRTAKTLSDGQRQNPMAALVCNFPRPGEAMQHGQVVTYFHEFGHLLHHILSETELASYAGTNTVRDFVEAPSQMFEEWAWSPTVLGRITGASKQGKIPAATVAKMLRARKVGIALATERQLFLAKLDLVFHSTPPSFNSDHLLEKIHRENFSFAFVPGTHFQSSFGHLISYDAGYYSYQWALSFAHDVLTRFKKEGLLSRGAAEAWRKHVLSRGGADDERSMLARFLGRAPNERAYAAYLNEDSSPKTK